VNAGRASVGHPVDVASGTVFTVKNDFGFRGTTDFVWRRYYGTDCPISLWLGPGWTTPYFMRLERVSEGYLLTDEQGTKLLFSVPNGYLEIGQMVANLGANMELRRDLRHFSVLHWHHGSDEVLKFFFELNWGENMPLTWIENLAGHRITVSSDSQGRPICITQEQEQRTVELTYNSSNLISAIHFLREDGARKLLVRYEYDRQHRLVCATDTLGNRTSYQYDAQNRMLNETNPLGSVFRFEYDDQGRCIYSSGNGGYMERRLKYSSQPRLTRVTDSLGYLTSYYLNSAGLVLQRVYPTQAVTTTEYDEYGRIIKILRSESGPVAYEYDERGNRVRIIHEDGADSRMKFNDLHRLVEFTNPKGATWYFDYDLHGQVVEQINPLGARISCERDSQSLVTQSQMPRGLMITHRYGARLRWHEARDQISFVNRTEYDEFGNEIEFHDALGRFRKTRYDELNRPVEIEDWNGRTFRLRWNALGEMLERTGPSSSWERWEYDQFGRLTSHSTAVGQMCLEYNSEDSLIAVVNRVGERLERSYDANGSLIEQKFFDGRIERYENDPRGRRTKIIKADGRTISQKYNECGCLVARESSDGLQEEFAYDRNAKLVLAQNGFTTVQLERDILGRVVAEVQNGRRVESVYDEENNRVARRLAGVEFGDIALEYDLRGRLVSVGDQNGICQELSWDSWDRLIRRRSESGVVEEYDFDARRHLRQQRVRTSTNGAAVNRRYEYDERGNLVRRDDRERGETRFSYDQINRLVEVSSRGRITEFYRYDAIGNMVETHRGSRELSIGGRVSFDGVRYHEYDSDGCVSRIGDKNTVLELRYDVYGSLVEVRRSDGANITYSYDALGRRVTKEVAGVKTEFLWQSCDVAAEIRNNKSIETYFLLNRGPLAQWRGQRRLMPIGDISGAVQEVVDAYGDVVWSGTLDAYGNLLSQSGSNASPFRFRGQYFDDETGLHYNFYRSYDPITAGYLSPDPIGLVGGSNFYAYPRNPLRWDDPFGLTCSNKHKGEMGEDAMDDHMDSQGYDKISSDDRPRGIDGVYQARDPNKIPQYVIGEAKYGSAGLGDTVHSGQQMSDQWIDTPIGKPVAGAPDRLTAATSPADAAAIRASAASNSGSVQKQVFTLPAAGQPVSPGPAKDYNPGSGGTSF
jgi:RHS repeat-associated protein